MTVSAVQPRVSLTSSYTAGETTRPGPVREATFTANAPVDACSAQALQPEPHTLGRVVSHILKPLPLWAATAGCIFGAIAFAALPGMGLLVALFAILAAIAAGFAVWRHIDIEHEYAQSQRIDALERKDQCIMQRLDAQPKPAGPIASADTPAMTSPFNALARPA
jgi:hypothetical protein